METEAETGAKVDTETQTDEKVETEAEIGAKVDTETQTDEKVETEAGARQYELTCQSGLEACIMSAINGIRSGFFRI